MSEDVIIGGVIIGIDPDQNGAVTIMESDPVPPVGKILLVVDTPMIARKIYDEPAMRAILAQYSQHQSPRIPALAIVEHQRTISKKRGVSHGVVSNATTVASYRFWCGLLVGLGIPYEPITPTKWQNAMFHGLSTSEDTKVNSLIRAKAFWPEIEWKGPKGGKKSGRTDSAVMCEYARRRGTVKTGR